MGQTLLHAFPGALLVVAALASIGAQRYLFPGETSPEEWKPAAEHVREHVAAGDVIRTHPPWNLDALPYLERLGEKINRQRDPLLEDLYRKERVWVLSETARVDEAIAHLPFESPGLSTERFGDATVIEAPIPVAEGFEWEFLEHLDEARVERRIYKKGKYRRTKTCENWSEEERRWDCGGRDQWLYVGEVYKYLGGDPHRAIWAHPLPNGNRLRVTFPKVPLDETLRIRAGFTYLAARRNKGADVHMKVIVDGETRVEETFPKLETTWAPHDIDTSEQSGETARVSVEVWSSNIRDRYFCINGWVL